MPQTSRTKPDSTALWQLPEMQHPLQNTLRPIFLAFLVTAISIFCIAWHLDALVALRISFLNIVALLLLLWLLSKHRLNLVGALSSGCFVASGFYCQIIGDGIHDVVVILHPIALGIAALLMNKWPYRVFSIVVVVMTAILSFAHNSGLLVNAKPEGVSTVDYFISPILLMAFALTIQKAAYLFRQALQDSEMAKQRYIDLFSATQDGIIITDWDGQQLESNTVFHQILGTNVIQSIQDLPHWPIDCLDEIRQNRSAQCEWSHKSRNTERRFVIRGKIINILNTEQLLWVFQDITEERKLQELAHRSDKLRLAGQLASGIAHDVNNQLTGIIGMVERFKAAETQSLELQNHASKLINHAQQVAEQLSQLLNLSKPQLKHRAPIDVLDLLHNAIGLTKINTHEAVSCTVETLANHHTIMGNANEVENVFVNLLINAHQALDNGGEIAIHIRTEYRQKSGIAIEIHDNGQGMSAEESSRIFEPFYTTKDHGTGLGLFMAYSIVNAHEGEIKIQSSPEQGTTVHLWLPTHQPNETLPPPQSSQPTPETGAQSFTQKPKILLIEDEIAISESIIDYLEYFDFQVFAAKTGKEADQLLSGENHFEVIVMDLRLPDRAGEALFNSICVQAQDTPIILISGFASEELIRKLQLIRNCQYLPKPFRFEQLKQAILTVCKTALAIQDG